MWFWSRKENKESAKPAEPFNPQNDPKFDPQNESKLVNFGNLSHKNEPQIPEDLLPIPETVLPGSVDFYKAEKRLSVSDRQELSATYKRAMYLSYAYVVLPFLSVYAVLATRHRRLYGAESIPVFKMSVNAFALGGPLYYLLDFHLMGQILSEYESDPIKYEAVKASRCCRYPLLATYYARTARDPKLGMRDPRVLALAGVRQPEARTWLDSLKNSMDPLGLKIYSRAFD